MSLKMGVKVTKTLLFKSCLIDPSMLRRSEYIGVAPFTPISHVRNKYSIIQGGHLMWLKWFSIT